MGKSVLIRNYMNIILENVVVGLTTTGVAKVMDGKVNVTNVPFNVSTRAELDVFIDKLLKNQVEFAGLTNGAFTVTPIPVSKVQPVNPLEQALQNVYKAQRNLELKIIDQAKYDAIVAIYKALLTPKP